MQILINGEKYEDGDDAEVLVKEVTEVYLLRPWDVAALKDGHTIYAEPSNPLISPYDSIVLKSGEGE